LGELVCAREHMEQSVACDNPESLHSLTSRYRHDAHVNCLLYAARALYLLGYPEQAQQRNHKALTVAQGLARPTTLAPAYHAVAPIKQFRRDRHLTQEWAEAVVTLSTVQGFPLWLAHGITLRGWALAAQGQSALGITQMREGLAAMRDMGAERER